jgi:O-antigen/teichoic acid export membrane protein
MESHETKKKALAGSVWTLFGYGGSQAIRLISNLVLARLLAPEAFGVMALVNIFIQGMHMFSDIGIGPSIIQSRRGNEPEFLNTAWTMQAVRGIILWIGFCLIAWPVSKFYGNDPHTARELLWVMPIIGLSTVISGFNSTSIFTRNRKLQIGAVTLLDMVPQIISVIVMLLWARVHPGVWALVAGTIASSALQLPMSHWLNRPMVNKFCWQASSVVELRRFGKWIMLGTIVAFLAANLDRIILGKLLTLSELGVYSMALTFARFGTEISTRLSSTVLFPVLSRSQDDPVTLVGQSINARKLILMAGGSLACAFAIVAPLFFKYCYKHSYAAAGGISQWLSIMVWFSIVLNSMERVPMALGHPRALFVSNLLNIIGYALSIPGYWIAGLPGFIIGLSMGFVIAHLGLMAWIPVRRVDMLMQTLFYTLVFFGYGGAVVLGTKHFAADLSTREEVILGLGLAALPCLVAGLLVLKQLRLMKKPAA